MNICKIFEVQSSCNSPNSLRDPYVFPDHVWSPFLVSNEFTCLSNKVIHLSLLYWVDFACSVWSVNAWSETNTEIVHHYQLCGTCTHSIWGEWLSVLTIHSLPISRPVITHSLPVSWLRLPSLTRVHPSLPAQSGLRRAAVRPVVFISLAPTPPPSTYCSLDFQGSP